MPEIKNADVLERVGGAWGGVLAGFRQYGIGQRALW